MNNILYVLIIWDGVLKSVQDNNLVVVNNVVVDIFLTREKNFG